MNNMEHLGDFAVTLCEESVDWNILWPGLKRERAGHSLRGECGLKYRQLMMIIKYATSLSARRVWIEIDFSLNFRRCSMVTLCEESVDWNTEQINREIRNVMSLSARRVWIEIWKTRRSSPSHGVTLCEESVDWNMVSVIYFAKFTGHSLRGECGLKFGLKYYMNCNCASLSARRVWIEIW